MIRIIDNSISVDPTGFTIINYTVRNKFIDGAYKLKVPYVWQKIGLHDRYFHLRHEELQVIILSKLNFPTDVRSYLYSSVAQLSNSFQTEGKHI